MLIGLPYRDQSWLAGLGFGFQFLVGSFLLIAQSGSDLGLWNGPTTRTAPTWWFPIALYALLVATVCAPIGIALRRPWGFFLEAPVIGFVLYALWRPENSDGLFRLPQVEPIYRWLLVLGWITIVWDFLARGFALRKKASASSETFGPAIPATLNRNTLDFAVRARQLGEAEDKSAPKADPPLHG